jgi:hypothetical protein
MIWLRIGF